MNATGKFVRKKEEIIPMKGKRKKGDYSKGDHTSTPESDKKKWRSNKKKTNRRSVIESGGATEYSKDPNTVRVRFLDIENEKADTSHSLDLDDEEDQGDEQSGDQNQLGDVGGNNSSAQRGIARRTQTVGNTVVIDSVCETAMISGGAWYILGPHSASQISNPWPWN